MIFQFEWDYRTYNFYKKGGGGSTRSNLFTIIVGKNGTGKSRMLRSVVTNILREHVDLSNFVKDSSQLATSESEGVVKATRTPTKIICVSTSPFDKFPYLRRRGNIPYYSYLGLRGLPSMNLGPAYMSRIIYTLIEAASKNAGQAAAITDVLDYLGYDGAILATFSVTSTKLLEQIDNPVAARQIIEEYLGRSATTFNADLQTQLTALLSVNPTEFRRVVKSAIRLSSGTTRSKIEVHLGAFGAAVNHVSEIDPQDIALLGRYGLLKLREVVLHKKESGQPFRMSELSSGEQSVIMGLLGIGSQIEDGALICIDEPEICLHPEWQERYIQLLSRIFSNFRGCHFIVATHSPQIVAQLPDKNCFVMQMEDGVAHPASDFASRSVDYQLALVFKAPGFKNEYLSRIAINTFAKVGKLRAFDQESEDSLRLLDAMHEHLRSDDPLRELIESLKEMRSVYGRH